MYRQYKFSCLLYKSIHNGYKQNWLFVSWIISFYSIFFQFFIWFQIWFHCLNKDYFSSGSSTIICKLQVNQSCTVVLVRILANPIMLYQRVSQFFHKAAFLPTLYHCWEEFCLKEIRISIKDLSVLLPGSTTYLIQSSCWNYPLV